MTVHKNTRLLPNQRLEIFNKYHKEKISVTQLAHEYHVSRLTIYKTLNRVRAKQIFPLKSINNQYRSLAYGLKRLAKIEKQIELKLKNQAKRYNKSYPGEMLHFDTVRLPYLKGESRLTHNREYLFVAVDDYSRELYAAIMPDKTSFSAQTFLLQVIDECPYTIEVVYSDNGKEYKGSLPDHPFALTCAVYSINQSFTKVRKPQINGKAERVIRTLKEMWYAKEEFFSRDQRRLSLIRFINFYNTVKPHSSLKGATPYEYLLNYFYSNGVSRLTIKNFQTVNNAWKYYI